MELPGIGWLPALDVAWPHALGLGLAFGALHAFDADHVATLGGVAVGRRAPNPLRYALRWAAGHAAALGLIALLVLGLGLSAARTISTPAEWLVGCALLVIGAKALMALRSRRREQAPHAHPHFLAPWHTHEAPPGQRGGVLLGILHGGAGSAAVLALLPVAHLGAGPDSAVFLACFSLGVAAGALAFAWLFARCSAGVVAAGPAAGAVLRAAVGVFALASGLIVVTGLALGVAGHGGG